MKPNNIYKLIITSFILLIILACNALAPAPTVTPLPALPTATPVILISQQVTLISAPYNETNQTPPYTITSQTPQLAGSDDPRVQAFNQRLNELVTKEVDTFRQSFLQNTAPTVNNGSSLEVTYKLISQINDIWSIKVDFSFYSDGAAHPGLYSITVNYDLGQGKELTLDDLFLPASNFLEVISNYCVNELSKQPFFDSSFSDGAQPTLDNYRNWNITPDGLMITFDEYQVAPYAAGPQTVIVPFSELQAIINPQGALGKITQ
ncbi:MAG TPA: RsiV family protein [Anaerolineales bacterium]